MKFSLEDLVDIPRLQELTDHLYDAAGIPSSIIAMDGEILTASGWQRICKDFHRKHPDIERDCIESDTATRNDINDGEPFCMYTCPRGLTDASIPIVVEDEHIANAFVGQVFLKQPGDETETRFREQAQHFGLDEEAYIEAFREVPVVSVERFRASLFFLANLAEMIASQSLQRKQELEAQKRSEAEADKSRDTFEEVEALAKIGIWDYDVAADQATWSKEAFRIFGVDPRHGALPWEDHRKIIHPDDWPAIDDAVKCAISEGRPYDKEFRIVHPDGNVNWGHTHGRAVRNELGEVVRLIGSVQDITERKQAIDDLEESEEILRAVLDATPFPVAIVNTDGDEILFWSRSAHSIFGHTAKTASEWYEVAYPDPVYRQQVIEQWNPFLEEARETGKPVNTGEYRVTCADGTQRICELWATFIPDRLIVTLNDVSERRKAEEELRQFEWLLEKEVPKGSEPTREFTSVYQNPTQLNTSRVILDGIGREALETMAGDMLDLLDTSVAIYEANGDYAHGVFESGWCRMMDTASFKLCGTDDVGEALTCGKWLCHENCWNESAKTAMETGEPTDIECVGGIRLYGVPIRAGDEIIGALNVGYSSPPRTDGELLELSEKYQIDVEDLRANSMAYKPRPPFIIDVAKRSCQSVAKIIGQTIERQRANAALSKTEAQHRTLIETIPDLIWLKDPDGVYMSCNRAFERFFGAAEAEIAGRTDYDFVDKETADFFRHNDRRALEAKGSVVNEEWLTFAENGYHGFFESIKTPMVDDEGNTVGVLGIARDITERNRIQDEIKAMANEQSWLLGSMINAFAIFESVFDEAGNFTSYRFDYINKAYEDITGVRLNDVRGKTIHEVWPKTEDSWVDNYGSVATSGDPLTFNMYHAPTEKLYHCHVYRPWETRDRFCVVFEDITEQKRTEEEKERLEEQLYHSQKMESIGLLAGGVAHDFNNLLTAITGNVDLAQLDVKPGDPLSEALDEINSAAKRAADLTQQLLAFSRKQIIKPKIINLNDLIRNLRKMLIRIIGEDLELKAIPQDHLGPIKADRGQIEQVIINLSINARDAMPDGGRLAIETANVFLDEGYCKTNPNVVPGDHVMLAVSDNGSGMDEETRKHIFDPFYTTKKTGQGTGLGLATVYGIVKQHGGSITVYSEVGEGTTFKIYFPLVEEEVDPIVEESQEPALAHGHETVLVVEDDSMVRTIAVRILTQLGYHVISAEDGPNALIIIENLEAPVDLLLTDVIMPNMNGRELAERVRQHCPETKILFTSGYTQDTIAHHGVLDEGLDFLGKPYTPQSLASKVRQVLDEG